MKIQPGSGPRAQSKDVVSPTPAPAAQPAERTPPSATKPIADLFRQVVGEAPTERLDAGGALQLLSQIRSRRQQRRAPRTEAAAASKAHGIPTLETGHDQIGIPGRPATLAVKLEVDGPSYLNVDLANREVRFFVDGQPIGTGRTNADGVASHEFVPEKLGTSTVTYELVNPADRRLFRDDDGQAKLFVLQDKPTLVVDIDGTLSDYPEYKVPFSGEKAPAFENSVQALNKLSENYNIVYLTARDDAFDEKTRGFLFKDHDPDKPGKQAFPQGPVFYNDQGLTTYEEVAQFDSERHAAFKTGAIKQLQMAGIPVVAGLGNAATDDQAYRTTGLDSFILDESVSDPGQYYRDLAAQLSQPEKLDKYNQEVSEIIERRNLTDPAARFQRDMDILTGTRLTTGNSVEVLIDGPQAKPEFLAALDSATESITYQSFEFLDDSAGGPVADKLIEKAAQGVDVRVVVDAVGSRDLPPVLDSPLVKKLREGGVEVLVHNPVGLDTIGDVLHRDHRKAIVIDGGKVAFFGRHEYRRKLSWRRGW